MWSHLTANAKPIPGLLLLVWVITLSCSHISLLYLFFLYRCFSPFPMLLPPRKLDSGSIPMLFSSFPSLWPNYLVFQDYWPWFIGCSTARGLHKHPSCFSAKIGQRNGFCSTANTQAWATNDCLLCTVHSD